MLFREDRPGLHLSVAKVQGDVNVGIKQMSACSRLHQSSITETSQRLGRLCSNVRTSCAGGSK